MSARVAARKLAKYAFSSVVAESENAVFKCALTRFEPAQDGTLLDIKLVALLELGLAADGIRDEQFVSNARVGERPGERTGDEAIER